MTEKGRKLMDTKKKRELDPSISEDLEKLAKKSSANLAPSSPR
jgi:hypothetical protein